MLTPYSEVGFYLEYHLHDLHQGTYYQPQTYCTYQGKICMTLVKVNKKATTKIFLYGGRNLQKANLYTVGFGTIYFGNVDFGSVDFGTM